MFNKNITTMARNNQEESPLVNQIRPGTVIDGDIKSNGDLRIDGLLTGTIDAKGKLVVGPTGNISGDVVCQNAEILGTINGKLTVAELLSLKITAKINGDIITNKLSIEPGANFSGSCTMGGVIKDIKHGENKGVGIRKEEKTA